MKNSINSQPSSDDLLALPLEAFETEIRRRELLKGRKDEDQSIEASKERCKTLVGFIKEAWHVVEPNTPLVWGWHIDAMAVHLEAVTYGRIIRLLGNVPPGTMKSLAFSVFWPAWEWGPAGLFGMRYLTSSYKDEFVARDSRKMRNLVQSDWYQDRWGEKTTLVRSGETSFENVGGGWREALPFKSLTAGRGDRVIIDDPHSVDTAESETERKAVIRTFRESVTTRLMDPAKSAILVVMQRLHIGDVSGTILSLGLGYEHLMLPMEFEPDRRCQTSIGFQDPRSYQNELLFPERFSREVVERDKAVLGTYAVAGQYQQRPTAREGGLFKSTWFNMVKAPAPGTRFVRYWDLAATKEQLGSNPAYTAGVKLGRQSNGRFVIAHVERQRSEGVGVRKLIRETAKADGPAVEIGFPQDPGQAGKSQGQDLVAMLAQYVARAIRESGDKMTRAEPIAAQAEAGLVDMVEGPWNSTFIDEATTFPASQFKDQVDALSGAYSMLIGAAMFTTPEDHIAVDGGFKIPSTWARVCVVDVSPTTVSTVWAAFQPSADTIYIYDALARPRTSMALHADALRTRGAWLPAVVDMYAHKRSEAEAQAIVRHLQDLGIEVFHMPLDMEQACMDMQSRFDSGRLRVFANLNDWFVQYRRLSRDEKGQITDADAGILRATGLLINGISVAATEARAASDAQGLGPGDYQSNRNVTGY